MKITWFSGTTFRIHIAGRILVIDPDGAPAEVDGGELVSGADTIVPSKTGELTAFEPALWQPRRRLRLIDDVGEEGLRVYGFGASGFIADSLDDGLLVIDHCNAPASVSAPWGRWADDAVAILAGNGAQCAAHGTALLDIARPRLIALAVTASQVDRAFDAVAPILYDTSLIVLEPGLAVEL